MKYTEGFPDILTLHVMKLLLFTFFTVFTVGICTSVPGQADTFPTNDGDITMTPVLHGTLVLEWKDRTIYIDPYGGAQRFSGFEKPDFVVITHAHGDHMDKETLNSLDLSSAELVAPPSVVDEIGDFKFNKVSSIANYEGIARTGVHIEAMAMYNLPHDETARHKNGWGNGYLVTLGGTVIYISGDTEDILEMRSLQEIDYAFVCMNQPYTMTVEQAADAVLEFKPKVVYPYHYRGQDGFSDVERFKELVSVNPNIEVRLRNWYPE